MRRLCVFCSSSNSIADEYLELATEMGKAIAASGIGLVYGGGGTGMMGALARGVLNSGGEAIGVSVRIFDTRDSDRPDLTELLVFDTLHERKSKMVELSDGFAALPGGLGTLDELVESLTWAQLGIHNKPIGLLNHNRYFDRFISLLDQAAELGFLYSERADLLISSEKPLELIERMASFRPQVDLADRWRRQSGRMADVEGRS
jgi:uncharacterized protein (TIGR00730 family)